MALRVIVNGAYGQMGQETVKAIRATQDIECVGSCGRDDDVLRAAEQAQARIVVDFTTPSVVFNHCQRYIEAGLHPIIGTTGLTYTQIQQLQELAQRKNLGGIIAPNFSIAVILMMHFATQAVRHYPQAEIIEMHHTQKKDAPSGTALKTAQMMTQAKQRHTHADTNGSAMQACAASTSPHNNSEISSARGMQVGDFPIHSLRLPGLVAHQEILFGGIGETLTLRQDTYHRSAFMPGVLLACRQVMQLTKLVYGLEHVLDQGAAG